MSSFEAAYARALEDHLRSPGEATLDAAYDLGRQAVRRRLGLLEILVTHENTLARLGWSREPVGEGAGDSAHPALDFLLQVVAVFEAPTRGFEQAREELEHRERQVSQLQAVTEASFKMLSTFDVNERLALLEEATKVSLPGACVAAASGEYEEEEMQELLSGLPSGAREAFGGFEVGQTLARASWVTEGGLVHLMVARAPTPIGRGPVVAAWRQGDEFSDLDVALFGQLSQLGSVAITNTEMFERERNIAVVLQRSLLPVEPPHIPGLEIATCYIPAQPGSSVGGDWFDAFEVPGARHGLVIGDVMGHDILSAAVMGVFRLAIRAYALEGHSPAAVLDRLESVCSALVGDRYATLIYSTVGTDGSLCLANAGHPSPVVISPDGRASLLQGGHTAPVCTGVYEQGHAEIRAAFPPGTTLFLYTDGLVDRRGSSIDDRLSELVALLSRLASGSERSLSELCDRAVECLVGDEPEDDVCVLAVRLTGR
jgi:serine phosphatase RsbU (regulator of sigma subunit)